MKAAEIEPYKIGAQREAAEICYEYGDYGNAMKYIERAIYLERELNGDDTNHRITKGYILINMKKYKEAEDVFREIIKKKTDFYQTLAEVGIGHIEISRGNYKLAQKYFQKMLIGDGNDIMANLGMAWLNSNQNEHQKALIYYDVILKENPFYILALLGKGNALMGLKRISEAESLFKKVLQIDPENEYALAELGIVAYYKGDDNNAEQLFNKSLSKNNKTYTCPYEGLGLLYLEQGKLKEAETNFKKAIDINPRIEYKKYNGLARIYLKHGKIEEAKKLLKKSIQNYPYDNEAKELLKKID
jgi:superkiller protein 3